MIQKKKKELEKIKLILRHQINETNTITLSQIMWIKEKIVMSKK